MNYLIILPVWLLNSIIGLLACQALSTLLLFWLYARYALGFYDKISEAIAREQAEEKEDQKGLRLIHLDIDGGS